MLEIVQHFLQLYQAKTAVLPRLLMPPFKVDYQYNWSQLYLYQLTLS